MFTELGDNYYLILILSKRELHFIKKITKFSRTGISAFGNERLNNTGLHRGVNVSLAI